MMEYMIERAFNEDSYNILEGMVGKDLVSIEHDGHRLADDVSLVQFNLEDSYICLRSFTDVVDFYGAPEDITALEMMNGEYPSESPSLQSFPIRKTIKSISVTTYHIHSVHDNGDIYNENLTAGLIIRFDDDSQLTFERADEFTEIIAITENQNAEGFPLIDSYVKGFDSHWVVTTSIETRNIEKQGSDKK